MAAAVADGSAMGEAKKVVVGEKGGDVANGARTLSCKEAHKTPPSQIIDENDELV
eukprot:COSAG02_NODE_4253_length_5584_cov_251.164995_8_plen_55_part_00